MFKLDYLIFIKLLIKIYRLDNSVANSRILRSQVNSGNPTSLIKLTLIINPSVLLMSVD